jgi:hypothetical protein
MDGCRLGGDEGVRGAGRRLCMRTIRQGLRLLFTKHQASQWNSPVVPEAYGFGMLGLSVYLQF